MAYASIVKCKFWSGRVYFKYELLYRLVRIDWRRSELQISNKQRQHSITTKSVQKSFKSHPVFVKCSYISPRPATHSFRPQKTAGFIPSFKITGETLKIRMVTIQQTSQELIKLYLWKILWSGIPLQHKWCVDVMWDFFL